MASSGPPTPDSPGPPTPDYFGPLRIERYVKDDRRSLILYTSAPRAQAPSDVSGPVSAPQAEPRAELREEKARQTWSDRSQIVQRLNELRGEQVVYAIHRQDRTFLPAREHCPLCPTRPGREETEIPFPAFEIAVFENRFPAFEAPHGVAEVVVYTDRHEDSFATLAPERAEALMWVWRQRYEELGARADVEYVLIFENRGVEVGVTLHHPHGQIYGYPFLPPVPMLELAADEQLGGCAPCALLARELEDGRRIVYENESVVVYIPYAARWPYEAHVVMREHRASLPDCAAEELRLLAAGLQALARGYDALFDRPFPYVMVVHQAPTVAQQTPSGHLHVEFYPPLRTAEKLKYLAGSEQGAGVFIGDTLPEESAAALSEAIARVE